MSANIDSSACKGNIAPINTRCLWNTNDTLLSQSLAAGFQTQLSARKTERRHMEERESGKNRREAAW